MLKTFLILFVFMFASVGLAEKTDGEIWNEGVDFYLSGDEENALRVMRPLLLSKSHGLRAAEVVAAITHAKAHKPGATNIVALLEEAADASQLALRAKPTDARANRNFTRATASLPLLRETERINKALERLKNQNAAALLLNAMHEARENLSKVANITTNDATTTIALADKIAEKTDKMSDIWIVAKETLCSSITNAEVQATISQQVDSAREKTIRASYEIGDLSGDAYGTLADVEHDLTRFVKLTISPPDAMREDLSAQTNALARVDEINSRAWQNEALDFTRAFRAHFPAWAKAYSEQAQSDTNSPPFTAETQEKIVALANTLEQLQLSCCEKEDDEKSARALEIINEIISLLPNKNSGSNNSQQQQNQQQPQNQNQQQQQNGSNENNANENENNENNENSQNENEDAADAEEAQDKNEDFETNSVLRKAQERSDEHEAKKRALMRKTPLPPNARDW